MWFLFSRNSRPAKPVRRPSLCRPQLETLEDRCVLSSSPLDPTFGSGGIVTSLFGNSAAAYAMALQPDGKILAAGLASFSTGDQASLVRYLPSGGLDTTFGSGGKVTTKLLPYARAMALYPNAGTANDGKIVLAGQIHSRNGTEDFDLVRYNRDGSLDTAFGSKGSVTTDLGSTEYLEAVAIQPDGKILAVGETWQTIGSHPEEIALARYNTNGTLDTTFGSGGKVISALGDNNAEGHAVAVQADGRIIVGGLVVLGGQNEVQFAVVRYNANGTLDTTFGSNHSGFTAFGTNTDNYNYGAFSVAIEPDGRIVAAGDSRDATLRDQWVVARYNSDGSFDTSFGGTGIVTEHIMGAANDFAYAEALQADGKVVVAGTHDESNNFGQQSFALARFNADGSLDTTFNGTGIVTTQIGTGSIARGVAIQPADGKIVLAGFATVNGVSNIAVARYLANGPTIGSFTASPNPVTAGSSVTLAVSNITDSNPSSSITQVAFYLDSNGDGKLEPGSETFLGYATQTSPGVWTLTFTVNMAPGTYTLFAQAEDNYTLFSDPFSVTLQVI
jgi:uncharacterized delta-60 repeat protein